MFGIKVARNKLKTIKRKTGKCIKDLQLGDKVWVTEEKTGLLVRVTIVHKFHVPGTYSEKVKKYEKNEDNIVWAKQELGNARFMWYALYANAEIEESIDGVKEEDKYLNSYSVKNLYSDPDFTSSLEPLKKQISKPRDFKKLLQV